MSQPNNNHSTILDTFHRAAGRPPRVGRPIKNPMKITYEKDKAVVCQTQVQEKINYNKPTKQQLTKDDIIKTSMRQVAGMPLKTDIPVTLTTANGKSIVNIDSEMKKRKALVRKCNYYNIENTTLTY